MSAICLQYGDQGHVFSGNSKAKDILIIGLLLLGGAYQCEPELARKLKNGWSPRSLTKNMTKELSIILYLPKSLVIFLAIFKLENSVIFGYCMHCQSGRKEWLIYSHGHNYIFNTEVWLDMKSSLFFSNCLNAWLQSLFEALTCIFLSYQPNI